MSKIVALAFIFAVLAAVIGPAAIAPATVYAQQPTPAAAAAPGVYVNSLRLQPAQPTFNTNVSFFPTFTNTADSVHTFTWRVYIYKADSPANSNSETSAWLTNFQPGTAELPSPGAFHYGATGRVCEYFFARVGWLDQNGLPVFFKTTSGNTFEQGFSVCDVSVVPTSVPPTAAPATPVPTPGPGLLVTGMRLQPEFPTFNNPVKFVPTFSNTANQLMTFKWRVFIFKADNLNQSNSETSLIQTGFPAGSGEVPALGEFHFGPTGKSCENFVARVGWLDADNRVSYFMQPDGRTFEKPFAVCDVLLAPTPLPVGAAQPTPIPAPGPGLFVSGIKMSPSDSPQHGQDATFLVSFNNTTDRVMTFNWRVLIYRVQNTATSNSDTSLQQNSFPVGTTDVPALGTFSLGPTGSACDAFVARVAWFDADNRPTFFVMPDGRLFEKLFSVCN